MSGVSKAGAGAATFLDERVGLNGLVKKSLRKIFPEHWSFMLGEIALYSFIILLLSGTYLTLFFKPSMVEVVYNGSYVPLKGVHMSEAFASTLDISFDVRGGMIVRQIHHWAALIFVAAISAHLLRIFFTGAFRKPRELNWIIGSLLLVLAILEGFLGYSLPDDLLSGTGLRISQGILLATPLVGTYAQFFLFGGEFPGDDFIPRIFTLHILVVPAIMLALITVHLLLVFLQKHTQFAGPGRTNTNVVGYPFLPVYVAKAGGFFFVVFGVTAIISGLVQTNPVWLYGPYHPTQISAGSQPDWYMGFLEGSLRAMPNWEINLLGHTLSLNIMLPAMILPGVMLTAVIAYPFIERWVTGDTREHHILDRPRNVPTRTAFGMAFVTLYVVFFINGGNDLVAFAFDIRVNDITYFTRIGVFVLPVLAFIVTKRICLGLQRRDRDKVLHGRETGIIKRLPNGEFIEVHAPLPPEERYVLTAHEVHTPVELPAGVDENGIPRRNGGLAKVRAKVSNFYFGERVEKPTAEEYHEITSGHGRH
jgi:ubiquinol-cytochrome c reductase cytochrome b subunit